MRTYVVLKVVPLDKYISHWIWFKGKKEYAYTKDINKARVFIQGSKSYWAKYDYVNSFGLRSRDVVYEYVDKNMYDKWLKTEKEINRTE